MEELPFELYQAGSLSCGGWPGVSCGNNAGNWKEAVLESVRPNGDLAIRRDKLESVEPSGDLSILLRLKSSGSGGRWLEAELKVDVIVVVNDRCGELVLCLS